MFLHFARKQNDARMEGDMLDNDDDDDEDDRKSIHSIVSNNSTLSSIYSVMSGRQSLRLRKAFRGGGTVVNAYMRPEEVLEFDMDKWTYNIDPEAVTQIKQVPDGPESKHHIKDILDKHVPEGVGFVPPVTLVDYLGPELCDVLDEKERQYKKHIKENRKKTKDGRPRNMSVRNMPPVIRASILAAKKP